MVAADFAGTPRAPLRAYYRLPDPGMPTVIVVHGLYDSKHSRYVRLTAQYLAAQGFGVLAPDMRWHGCLARDWLPTLGIEEGKDLVAWAGWLHARTPESAAGLLGFSLGALDVVHALASDGENAFPAGGVAISLPAGLERTLERLDDPPYFSDYGMQSFIRRFFQAASRKRMRTLHLDTHAGRPFSRLLDWLVQQPPHLPGSTAAAAFAAADPGAPLRKVRRPLVLITSRRDPICGDLALADLESAAAANLSLHLFATTDGGHIGQIGVFPQWTADLLARFFRASAWVASPPK
ncbi:MAG: hypothetical protein M3O15_08420 [Acidobacteriota bacterium]|nr:hypothetical protein [Acidobacteriota bacterium]